MSDRGSLNLATKLKTTTPAQNWKFKTPSPQPKLFEFQPTANDTNICSQRNTAQSVLVIFVIVFERILCKIVEWKKNLNNFYGKQYWKRERTTSEERR